MARVPDRDVFEALNLIDIGIFFKHDRASVISWLRQYRLLANAMECEFCENPCVERKYERAVDKVKWRCNLCGRRFDIRTGSFFQKSHLQLWQILGLTYIWSQSCGRARRMSVDNIMAELDIGSNNTVVDWSGVGNPVENCRKMLILGFQKSIVYGALSVL